MAERTTQLPDLDALLADVGCPFHAGSREAVLWLDGYRAGLRELMREEDAKADRILDALKERDSSVIILSERRR